MTEGGRIERHESQAFLETRHELGPSYEQEIVEAFAERIERAVEARSGGEIEERRARRLEERGDRQRQLALGIVSLGASIPISIPLGVTGNLTALVVSWLGIVGINAAHAAVVNGRRHRPDR
jgi:hypothetical protein